MCDSNGDSAKVTNEGRSMDEGFCHLMGAMYNDMPSELDSQTKRNSEMTRSIRSIRLPRPTAFAARYVTKVLHPSPMIVSKRFVKPQMLGDNNGQGSDQDRLLRKLFCVPLLSKIVLLITPRGSNSHMNDMFNIHAYMIEDQFHLGVTSLTASERELFVNPQKPNNYALICCSGYIHLEDAFMNASLKKNIIRLSKNKSNAVVEIKCKGKRLSLQYTGDPHQPKIEATGSGKSRQVKIPARNATAEIYPLQLKNISTNRQINAATSEVSLEIVDNQIEELSEANANSVEQPQPLSQIVHPSIQQNIDNFKQIVEQQPATETEPHVMDKVEHNEELSAELLSNKVEQVPQEDKENINASIEKIEEPIIQQNNKNIEQIMETSDQHLNNAEKVPKEIVNSEIEELSQSNANSVEQPQPLAQIVHQNIQQNIDNVEQIMELAEQQPSTETELQSTNHVEHNEELPPIESKLHSIEKVEQIEELLRNAMKNMPQQLLSSSTILQIKASSELRTIIADEAQDEKKENIASVEQVKETIIQEGHMKTSDLINNSKIEKQKINKLLSNEAKKAIIRDSFQWNPIDMWKPPEEFNETVKKPPTLQTFNKLHKEMLKQFQINRRLKVLEKEQIANEALNSKHKKQTNENLDQLMKSSELNLLAVENSQEKSKDELPQEVTCNCRLEQLENPSEPCEVENIQKITNDVSELLQDELKDIKDVPIEDVREVKEVQKQVNKPTIPNFNKEYKERLKQFQIDRRLKKSLQSQQAVNETSQSSLFKEQQLNNRPQIPPVYQRSISSCSQYSYRGRRQSRIFSKSQPDKMLSSGGTWDVRVKQKRSSCKSLVTETRKPQWVTAGLNSKHRNYVVIHKPKEVITLKALEENYERDMSSAGDAMPRQNNMLVLYEQDDDDYDPNYCYELWPPQLLQSESEGRIDESTIDCLIPNSQTILDANSTQFERMMQHPVAVPKTFSHRARQLIEDKLSSVDAKQAFHNLGSLIRRVNSRPIPHERHLQILFRLFARLDVQLFVRAEFNLPGCDPTPKMPRCRIECFFFPDRSDFIVSMAVLRSQLEQLMRQIPQILPNLHYCRDAFDLTRVPDVVRNYVRSYFNKLLKDLIAEYCYQLIQEKTPISAMPYVPTDHDILGDDIFLRPKATKFLPLTRKKLS
ncbi:uncharacterized protein LOC117574390 isoform X2 [Drosophila albomicans]|uniref:Uncharacterized protein LOC117574390 isoform X2 n=1 Tax=Drosophila albomicans TaxID=7291 RepID=A0A9C6T7H2_DROAB|nr:uncharacterized protein LOC117574390 isoform X2 [Drosophila albomicans]